MKQCDDVPTGLADERLLAEYAAGDAGRFAALVERYHVELHRFLMRFVGDATLAEDVVQETFLQVHLSAASFDRRRTFRPWLFTIAVNKARDQLRSRARKREIPLTPHAVDPGEPAAGLLDFLHDEVAAPDAALEAGEQAEAVRDVVSRMPDHLREVLVLGYYHRFPYKEMAAILGVPLGTVKSRLHAAVSAFATAYRQAATGRIGAVPTADGK